MVHVLVEGDGSDPATVSVTAQALTSYSAASSIPVGSRTSEQQQIVDDVEAAVATIASTEWTANQQAAQASILEYAAELQADMNRIIRQYAPRGQERALTEMLSVVTRRLVDLKRDVIG